VLRLPSDSTALAQKPAHIPRTDCPHGQRLQVSTCLIRTSAQNISVQAKCLGQSHQRDPGGRLHGARRQYHASHCISPCDRRFGTRVHRDCNAMGDTAKISPHVLSTVSSRSVRSRWDDVILPGRKDPRNWADPRHLGKSQWDTKLGKIESELSLYNKMRW
jgi:hypothetical protein